MAIVAGGLLGATGGVDADAAFLLAVSRATEICIGIVCAGRPATSCMVTTVRHALPGRLPSLPARAGGTLRRGFARVDERLVRALVGELRELAEIVLQGRLLDRLVAGLAVG